MPDELGIPKKTTSVNVGDVHPEIRHRVRQVLNDGRLKGLARMSSGARTHALQTQLYARYKAGNGPLAANPNYRNPNTGRLGSAHQVQNAGGYSIAGLDNSRPWAYAVDVGFYGPVQSQLLRATMDDYGMTANLWSAGEWWHYVPKAGVANHVLSGQGMVGDQTTVLQKRAGVTEDGWHGPNTTAAIAKLQTQLGVVVSGDWVRSDENAWAKAQSTASQGTGTETLTRQQALDEIREIIDRAP